MHLANEISDRRGNRSVFRSEHLLTEETSHVLPNDTWPPPKEDDLQTKDLPISPSSTKPHFLEYRGWASLPRLQPPSVFDCVVHMPSPSFLHSVPALSLFRTLLNDTVPGVHLEMYVCMYAHQMQIGGLCEHSSRLGACSLKTGSSETLACGLETCFGCWHFDMLQRLSTTL